MPEAHRRLRLILNLLSHQDSDTPRVNTTNNREAVPESLQFDRAFPRILQAVWEAYPVQDLVQVSNMDITDAPLQHL